MGNKLAVGVRMYNHGDRCNPSHFGTITAVRTGKWGTQYEITPDEITEEVSGPYYVPLATISDKFLGHGGTRIVTESAYKAWQEEQLSKFSVTH